MPQLVPSNRRPISPGSVLREDFLEPLKMTQGQLAAALGVDRTSVSELLNERRKVTTEMALRLAHTLRTSPEYWINLQIAVDLFDAAHSPLSQEISRLTVLVR
ncbi:MAG TPA: HigA family addiction module antitoxin [Candidatus Acidoferrales bacterium]|jgi:addiction module HigA family antidote|nr:HigA family addiction module antitoxin [Candidatus Acidoferrales bacterium]